ncbi:MAG: helix-turn-helix domain-containing protein, partial [Candidatus Thermoplasmatota archaeon]
MDTFGLAVKELILLHLEEHFEEQFNFLAKKIAEPPIAVSQEGIKEGTGLTQPQISRGIKSLEKEELIERKKIFVKATGRFRDFYFLQRAGIHKATKLKEELDQKSVKVKDIAGKTKE